MAALVNSGQIVARPQLSKIIEQARGHRLSVAIAYPCDTPSLQAVCEARAAGLMDPILVGPRPRMSSAASKAVLSLDHFTVVESPDDPRAAARQAVALCREGQAAALMKGSLHSDELLAAIVRKEQGIRGERRISHVYVMDIPTMDRPLLISDAGVNITPTLADKVEIARNAIECAHALGIALPRVAILSAVETVSPAIQGTLDAAALCKMADRKQITGAILDGPLAFDNAMSERAARDKGIDSPVAGRPDVLLLPNLEAGNMVCKVLVHLGGAECAGIILGAAVPVILTSRVDSIMSRVASCALAVLHAKGRGEEEANRPAAP